MKHSKIFFTSLVLNCTLANAGTEAIFADNLLHIPHAVYKGVMYDVKMGFTAANQLTLQSANPVTGSELENSAYSTVQVSDELKLTLADISAGGKNYRADIAIKKESAIEFNATGITLIDTNITFSDTLNIAYYNLTNPKTGHDQLAVYDAKNNQHTVVKTDVILGKRNFVFGGSQEGDKTVYQSRKYGIFLDPAKENESRTASDGRGGQFEYSFYFDNAFKRYDIKNPATENVIFDANMLSPKLKEQGLAVMEGAFQLFNTVTDADNSYVEIKAFEKLPDVLRGESASDLLHAPILIRLSDSSHTNAHFVSTLKDTQGKVVKVLAFYDAVHKKGGYPEGDEIRQRLQICEPDLSTCAGVDRAGSDADGRFYYQTETDQYIYLTKDGSKQFYAFNKTNHTLTVVTGIEYPAVFNHKKHVVPSDLGHGNEVETLSNFSSLSGMNVSLSEGADAFLAINYDLDNKDPVGKYQFLGDIHLYKHGQVIKFNGLTGVKMFDNGDGIDQGDESDAEKAEGHINLIAYSTGRLLVEIGNYDAESAKGNCKPDENGYYCSSLKYGSLNLGTNNANQLDSILHEMPALKFFTARRIAPFAVNDKLYISLLEKQAAGRGGSHEYTLHTHALTDLSETAVSTGRTYVTRSAKRKNGINEGEVLTWDGATNILTNLTRHTVLGNVNTSTSSAISSTFGRTAGIPLAGIGNLFALRADPGEHQWYLVAGETDKENGLETVDHVPFSAWLYE